MDKKCLCLLCNSQITFANSMEHFDNIHLKDYEKTTIDELFLLRIQLGTKFESYDDYTIDKKNPYWLFVLIPSNSKFSDLDEIIRTVWCRCCSKRHNCNYFLCNGKIVTNEKQHKHKLPSSQTKLSDGITLLKKIQANKNGTVKHQPIIVSQNDKHSLQCKFCMNKNCENNYCVDCKVIFCNECNNEHDYCYFDSDIKKITNDPRCGIDCGILNGEFTNEYFYLVSSSLINKLENAGVDLKTLGLNNKKIEN